MRTKVILFGIGNLGTEIFRALQSKSEYKVVGVVDNDPTKVGQDAGIISNVRKSGIKVVSKIIKVKSKPDIVIHATISSLKDAHDQLSEIIKSRISVVSTCEQLVYPIGRNKKIARRLDNLSKKYKVSVVGVGVNPGFLMDSMVLMLSGLCSKIKKIKVERVVDLTRRRKALQKKMCLGYNLKQLHGIQDTVGHVGLAESAMMICDMLNEKTTFRTKITPIIAKHSITSNGITVKRGQISGIEHRLVAKRNNSEFLKMNLVMYAGAQEYDVVEIEGTPPIYVKTAGVNGDKATVSLLLNYIPIVLSAKPGFHTINELRIPTAIK